MVESPRNNEEEAKYDNGLNDDDVFGKVEKRGSVIVAYWY